MRSNTYAQLQTQQTRGACSSMTVLERTTDSCRFRAGGMCLHTLRAGHASVPNSYVHNSERYRCTNVASVSATYMQVATNNTDPSTGLGLNAREDAGGGALNMYVAPGRIILHGSSKNKRQTRCQPHEGSPAMPRSAPESGPSYSTYGLPAAAPQSAPKGLTVSTE